MHACFPSKSLNKFKILHAYSITYIIHVHMSKPYFSVYGHIHVYVHMYMYKLHMYKDIRGYIFTYVKVSDVAWMEFLPIIQLNSHT